MTHSLDISGDQRIFWGFPYPFAQAFKRLQCRSMEPVTRKGKEGFGKGREEITRYDEWFVDTVAVTEITGKQAAGGWRR